MDLSAPCFIKFGKTVESRYIFYLCFAEALFIICSLWKSQQLMDFRVRHNWSSQVCIPSSELILRGAQNCLLQCLHSHNIVLISAPVYPFSSTLITEVLKQRTEAQQLTVKSCLRPHFINSEL